MPSARFAAQAALIAFVALVPAPLRAQDEPPHEVEAPTVPDPKELANGLQVFVLEKHNVPLVTIEIAVRAGAFVETKETNGLSHLYEHMFFKGNKALPTQEAYMKRMHELGISFNGTTGTERVNYYITLPSKNLAHGMKFMSDALLTPLFLDEELVKEREVVIGEYDRNEASPMHYLHEAMRKNLYGEDELRKNPLGVREIILSAKRETMVKFKERLYIPNNACLVVSGDVNVTEAVALTEKYFGAQVWARGDDPFATPLPPMQRLEKSKASVVTRERAPMVLSAAWNGPDVGRDARATYIADVWGTLCGQRQSRLQRAFVDAGLSPGVSMSYFTQREGGELHFQAQILKDKVFEARDVLFREVDAMAAAGYFTEEDLALAKHSIHVDRAFEVESTETASHNLTFWWATAGIEYYARYLPEVDNVTLEDVRTFVRTYLTGRPVALGCLASKKKAEELGLEDAKLLPSVTKPSAAADVKELALENGIKVIARRDAQARVAALYALIRGGSSELTPETQGAERLSLAVALEATKDLTKDQLRRELERAGARLALDANYDYSLVGIAAPCDAEGGGGFVRAVELLAQCLEKPALEAKSFEEKRAEMKARLDNERANPDSFLSRVTNRTFFSGHPYLNRPDGHLDSVEKLTQDTVKETLAKALRSNRLILVSVSPLEIATTQQMLQKRFGWIPKDDAPAKAAPAFKPGDRLLHEKQTDIPTNYVLGKCEMPGPGSKDYPASRILMTLLHQRLWESIRTKHNLSYAVQAGLSTFRANYGILYVTSTQPQKCADLMRAEIKRLKEELVSEDDVRGAVAPQTTSRLQQIEGAAAHAAALGHAELTAGSWARLYEEPAQFAAVTPEAIRDAAKKYLKGWVFGVIGKDAIDADKFAEGD